MSSFYNPNIPRPLNEPIKMSRWTVNELGVFLSFMMFLWVIGSLVLGILVGFTAMQIYNYLRKLEIGDITKKGKYWFFYNKRTYSYIIPSYFKEIVG